MTHTLLLAEDDRLQQQLITKMLEKQGEYQVVAVGDGKQALNALRQANHDHFSAVLLDINMPHMNGFEVLEVVRRQYRHLPVIMLTGETATQNAVKAIKSGAFDFVPKPIDAAQLLVSLKNALHLAAMSEEISRIKRNQSGELTFRDLVGYNGGLSPIIQAGMRAAKTNAPVMITGHTGTGKELFARAIHGESNRAGKPFVAINCGAIPQQLVESILFGHEKGAFTGATEKTLGKFREAEGGTVFLDELGELPLTTQVKLLRVLQEQEIEPVGSSKAVKVDVRLISATNRDLMQQVKHGEFREDLYFRLNVLPIHIPSLKERGQDILQLAEYFLQQAAIQDRAALKPLTSDARQYLLQHPWPGNIRELANLMRRASVWCDGEQLTEDSLRALQVGQTPEDAQTETSAPTREHLYLALKDKDGHFKTMEALEQEVMQTVLLHEEGNITKAAEQLAIAKSTFYRKLKEQNQPAS